MERGKAIDMAGYSILYLIKLGYGTASKDSGYYCDSVVRHCTSKARHVPISKDQIGRSYLIKEIGADVTYGNIGTGYAHPSTKQKLSLVTIFTRSMLLGFLPAHSN